MTDSIPPFQSAPQDSKIPDESKNAWQDITAEEGTPKERRRRHDLYYFENVIFEVEDTLFCVPKHRFNVEDTIIGDMFSLPTGASENGTENVEGSNENCPIVLEAISKDYFVAFLKVLYPLQTLNHGSLTIEDWIGVLHLSTMWFYRDIREHAITNLDGLLPKDDVYKKILLAKKYRVKRWLLEGYSDLITRKEWLDVDDLSNKGLDDWTLARIYCLRSISERYNRDNISNPYGSHNCTRCGRACTGSHSPQINLLDAPQFTSVEEHTEKIFAAELGNMN